MTERQKQVLARLIELAGSSLLVDEAFAEMSKQEATPTLEDIVRYILDHRDAWHARHAAKVNTEREAAGV